MAIATGVSFMQGLGPLALAPMFRELMKSFDADLADVVQFTGVSILVLGFSNFIWWVLYCSDTFNFNFAVFTDISGSLKGS